MCKRWGAAERPGGRSTRSTRRSTGAISWNGGPIGRRVLTVGDRTFTLTSTDHHGELASEAGVVLGPDDPLVGAPAFSPDSTVAVYATTGGAVPANPDVSTRVVAVDTTTGDRLWERVLPTDIADVFVTDSRVVAATRATVSVVTDDQGRLSPPAALTALDLTTGEVMVTVPAGLDAIHVG